MTTLLFIGLLVLLIGFSRRLVWVVTSFTAGHAAALIGFAVAGIRVSPLWVEPMIALTVAFMARECIVRAESAIPKTPVVIALGFGGNSWAGLFHGDYGHRAQFGSD